MCAVMDVVLVPANKLKLAKQLTVIFTWPHAHVEFFQHFGFIEPVTSVKRGNIYNFFRTQASCKSYSSAERRVIWCNI